ncbi:MAG: hypothetical protein EA350_07295 [Gemmatimonadales bacterium]|nr:MAG: hypothetical protein EA350_07295 [Gemmatimonadales bacterium]
MLGGVPERRRSGRCHPALQGHRHHGLVPVPAAPREERMRSREEGAATGPDRATTGSDRAPPPAEAGTRGGEIPQELHAMGDRGAPPVQENPRHTRYHPKWHRQPTPLTWWTRNRRYRAFILRELTSVAVLYAAVLLLIHLLALDRGPESHAAFQAWLARPGVVAFHLFVLAALLYHTVTWLNLAPQAIALRIRGRRVPSRIVLLAHHFAWLALSAIIVAGLLFALGDPGEAPWP